jgi:ligand-binding sensor domain-containing protein
MRPRQVVQTLDKRYWIAEEFAGLLRFNEKREFGYYTPPGPLNANSFDIYANNGSLWVAHGGYTDKYLSANNPSGICNYKGENWKYYFRGVFRPFDTLSDFSFITRDEANGTTYMGSFQYGVYELKADGTGMLYNRNVIYDPSASIGSGFTQIVGLALDSKKNLWSSTMFTFNQLYVKTPENEWYKFKVPNSLYGGNLVIDDNDQIWMVGNDGGGLSVYNTNGTIADRSDDATYHLSTGKTFGNLPSNSVNCLAKDKNNNIWVGTANGIGIVNNCTPPFTQQAPCDAEIPVVQYDQYAGFLFAGNNVRTIAVDGANRKWVGTDDGVWLLSPDAGSIVYRFTVDNSPLPSNRIQKISIDGITGEVYIGTEQGLMSFRSTATEGGTSNENVLVFPNPVPSGFSGTIAIKGLVANADVRITDINGQLVYRTKALGGQAVWNGLDYKGHRPQSGVYLIFSSDTQGEETHTGKVVFLK